MTPQEFKELELLFAKLGKELGNHRFGIIPHYTLNDGVHVITYDSNGEMEHNVTQATLQHCVELIKLKNERKK